MRTAHLTKLTTSFSPFSPFAKTARLFLTLLPPNAHHRIAISQSLLPRDSNAPAFLELAFKDGKTLKYKWGDRGAIEAEVDSTQSGEKEKFTRKEKIVRLQDIIEEVNRHERLLERKEELAG